MHNSRTGAFAVVNPNNIGIAVRRPAADPESGYEVWQLDGRPFVVASLPLSGLITQKELQHRVNALARIKDARSVDDVQSCIGDVLNAVRASDAHEAEMFEEHAHQLANQVAVYTKILRRDLISRDCVPGITETIREAAPRAIRGYIRGWYVSWSKVTKESLISRHRPEAFWAVTNALREYDIDVALVEEICSMIFDEILSYRLSPWAKQIIVTGFAYCKPRVGNVEFDGSYFGQPKINSSDHDVLGVEDQSFFLDAGNCYEVGRFARGLNSDVYSQALAVTEDPRLPVSRPVKTARAGVAQW